MRKSPPWFQQKSDKIQDSGLSTSGWGILCENSLPFPRQWNLQDLNQAQL